MQRFDRAPARLRILLELLGFIWRRRWWLTPVVITLVLLGLLLTLAQTSVLAPFIYTLF